MLYSAFRLGDLKVKEKKILSSKIYLFFLN